jgi:hypothetical protein
MIVDLGFTAHEAFPANPPEKKSMDLHNNMVGLNIGRTKGTNLALSLRCMAAVRSGKLQVVEK